MTRLFISLLAILLLAVLGYFLGINSAVSFFIKDITENERAGQIGGITQLLDEQMMGMTPQQRYKRLAEVQSIFNYSINLIPLDELSEDTLSSKEKQRLIEKGIISAQKKMGEINYFISKIDNHVWELQKSPSLKDQDTYFMNGPLALINQQLSTLPTEAWEQEIQRIGNAFEPPMRLLTLKEAQANKLIDEQQFKRLLVGKSVLLYEQDRFLQHVFNRINQSNYVLKMGPMKTHAIIKNIKLITFLILSILIATAIWLWLRPIWRDLSQLKNASEQFGDGQLNTRIKLPKYSFINSSLKSFNGMAEHIEQLITSHKALTNAVSHELRTPVSRLRFGLDMLEKADNDADKARYVESMNTDIDELDTMLAELLSYARMDRQEIKLNKSPIVLTEWLQQQTKYWADNCNNIQLNQSHHGLSTEAIACMDQKMMTRALHNLIQNACRYAKSEINIHLKHKNGQYTLSVEDDGLGIPQEYHATIFDPFTRVDDSRDRDSGGYGLGLAIVKQIIKAHQGTVQLEQSALGGAKFVLKWDY